MLTYFKNIKNNFKLKHYVNYIVISALFALFTILYTTGGIKRSFAYLLAQIAYSIILAVSLNLVVGFLGELSLGHAGFMCVGAYIGTFFSNWIQTFIGSPTLALVLAMVVGGAAAAAFGFIVGLPALRLKGDYLAIVTLASGEIVRNIFMNLPYFGGAMGLQTNPYGPGLFIVAIITMFIMLVTVQNLVRSKHGRAITAIRDSEIAAKSMGINVTYYKLFAFVVAAFFAGVAGVLYGAYNTPILYSAFSYNYSIEILVMVVLGGMGSINGSIIAATALTVINFYLTKNLSGDFAALKYFVYAVILITLVIYNNAPALKKYRDRFSLSKLSDALRSKFVKQDPSDIRDDSGAWDVIPTKIKTDEVLSTDITLTSYEPDKPDRGGNNE